MMVLSSGRCAPCSLASSIEDSTSRPSELRKRTLVLVLGQVVLTEPCGSVSVIRWIIATLRVLLVASLPEMRTAHARMSIDGICVQVRGNVVRVSLARNSIWRTSTKGEAHFCISRVRNAVAPNKSGFAPLQILLGNIAARIRSLNFAGKVTGVPVPVLAQTPLLGHPRAFQRYFAYQVPHSGRPCNHVTVTEPSEKKVARKLAISRQSPRPKIKGFT